MRSPVRHLRNGALFLIIICGIAILGYVIAGWSVTEAAYMAVITVFAVGYEEVNAVTSTGLRIFTMLFVIFGCTGYLYIGGALVQFLIEDQIESVLGKRRMSKSISELNNHTIVCGYGRVGRILCKELKRSHHPFVIVDQDESIREELTEEGLLFIHADATNEETLIEAGIERAQQIAIVIPQDAANVFITLSARNLNPDLNIIARGMTPTTEAKLKQAGADRVVLAEQIGAERIASLILRPTVSSLIEKGLDTKHLASDFADLGLRVEEFSVPEGSNLEGLTLESLEMKGSSAFLIVAVVRVDGESVASPSLDTPLHEGDTLITLCHDGKTPEFASLFRQNRGLQTES